MRDFRTFILICFATGGLFFAGQFGGQSQLVASPLEEMSVQDQSEYEMCLVRVYGNGFTRSIYGIHIYYPDGSSEHVKEFEENAEHPASVYQVLNELSQKGWRVTSNSISNLAVGGMRSSESTIAEYILERKK